MAKYNWEKRREVIQTVLTSGEKRLNAVTFHGEVGGRSETVSPRHTHTHTWFNITLRVIYRLGTFFLIKNGNYYNLQESVSLQDLGRL